MRSRCEKFPALLKNTVMDWFYHWPHEALISVADKYLQEAYMPGDDMRQAIIEFMPFTLNVVNETSEQFHEAERRFVYTTPKSYLEFIKLFKSMLSSRMNHLEKEKEKLLLVWWQKCKISVKL